MEKTSLSKKDNKPVNMGLLVSVVLIIIGSAVFFSNYISAERKVYDEYDTFLSYMARAIDHHMEQIFEQCSLEMDNIVSSDELRTIEISYLINGSRENLKDYISKASVLSTSYAERILFWRNSSIVFSGDSSDDLNYSYFKGSDFIDTWIFKNNTENKYYLGIPKVSKYINAVYFLLIDIEVFYETIQSNEIFNDYWVVLYDKRCDLIISNENLNSTYRIISREDMRMRNDGYTALLSHEENGISGPDSYDYTDENGVSGSNRMYGIPTNDSKNKIFTVGIAMKDEHLVKDNNTMVINISIGILILSLGVFIFLYTTMHIKKRNAQMTRELAILEQEKNITSQMLNNQQELMHHQKLETMGMLTAGVAHEFNNLLSPIVGNIIFILEKTENDNSEMYDCALEIYKASKRAKDLVSRISRLSRKMPAEHMHPVIPSDLINEVLSVATPIKPRNIAIEKYENTKSPILGDEGQLVHMFLNLVINAFQAMEEDGGILTISTRDDGSYVYFSFEDTGKGIPEENLHNIFEPFFTTKPAGKGTGLGLAICQRTVNNHRGEIKAENNPGGGAKFTVSFRIYNEEKNNSIDL